jgi:hypothetical protein
MIRFRSIRLVAIDQWHSGTSNAYRCNQLIGEFHSGTGQYGLEMLDIDMLGLEETRECQQNDEEIVRGVLRTVRYCTVQYKYLYCMYWMLYGVIGSGFNAFARGKQST